MFTLDCCITHDHFQVKRWKSSSWEYWIFIERFNFNDVVERIGPFDLVFFSLSWFNKLRTVMKLMCCACFGVGSWMMSFFITRDDVMLFNFVS